MPLGGIPVHHRHVSEKYHSSCCLWLAVVTHRYRIQTQDLRYIIVMICLSEDTR